MPDQNRLVHRVVLRARLPELRVRHCVEGAIFDILLEQFLRGRSLPARLSSMIKSWSWENDAILLQQTKLHYSTSLLGGYFLARAVEATLEKAKCFRDGRANIEFGVYWRAFLF